MMRLTRKLYSEPDEEDENDEKTWKRRRNVGIVGAGTGTGLIMLGRGHEKIGPGVNKKIKQIAEKSPRTLKWTGGVLASTGAALGIGSEIKRRKLKKNDENKA